MTELSLIDRQIRRYNKILWLFYLISFIMLIQVPAAQAEVDNLPPTSPAGLTAIASSSNQIQLEWTSSTDNIQVAGYKILRSTDNLNFQEVYTAATNRYLDRGLTPVSTYYYKIQAYDTSGNLSGYSNTASATTGAAGAFSAPHGPYIQNPNACAACHSSHAALGINLLNQATITGVCYTCHDGTGSNYNIQNLFATVSGNIVFHPVNDTGNAAITGAIECTSCHNPHGDKDIAGNLYPRLLHSSDGGSSYYQGNDFCLACHGPTDRNFTGPADTYWEDTLGDHSNSAAAHYDGTKAALQPASGTAVTCVQCHDQHASANERLLAAVNEPLCYSCHDDAANSMSGRNIKAEYSQPVAGSLHDLTGAGAAQEVRMRCTSCHGPHTVGPESLRAAQPQAYSALSDPDNTKKVFTSDSTATGNVTIGDDLDFCLSCHDGSPPTAVASPDAFVPESIVFPSAPVTINASGYNKSAFLDSTHHTAVGIHCMDCHEDHGSVNYNLWKYPEDTAAASGICLRCHDGGNPSYPTAQDIKIEVIKGTSNNYRHPVLDINAGVNHFNKEVYANRPLTSRHAECTDCHDPHSELVTPSGTVAPMLPGPLKNISGVGLEYVDPGDGTPVTWNNYGTKVPTFTFKYGADYQYEICFKCHSYFSYGNDPPAPGTTNTNFDGRQQTDPAKEFNPANPGGHLVIVGDTSGVSKKQDGSYYGAFVGQDRWGNPWTAESYLYCDDCHGSDDPNGPQGPHGSNNKFILKKPYKPATDVQGKTGTGADADSASHLCFSCHDYDVYNNPNKPLSYGINLTAFKNASKGNLHLYHSGKKRRSCNTCHSMVVHGSRLPHLLVTGGNSANADEFPYNNYAQNEFDLVPRDKKADAYSQNLINAINSKAGNWGQSDCTHNVCG